MAKLSAIIAGILTLGAVGATTQTLSLPQVPTTSTQQVSARGRATHIDEVANPEGKYSMGIQTPQGNYLVTSFDPRFDRNYRVGSDMTVEGIPAGERASPWGEEVTYTALKNASITEHYHKE